MQGTGHVDKFRFICRRYESESVNVCALFQRNPDKACVGVIMNCYVRFFILDHS